jgi:phage-related protein
MGGGLFELRPKGKEGIGRVFYCTQAGQAIVILHSLVKKTNTTPAADLQLARKRLNEVNHGYTKRGYRLRILSPSPFGRGLG